MSKTAQKGKLTGALFQKRDMPYMGFKSKKKMRTLYKSDRVKSLIGAIYLDSGIDLAEQFLKKKFSKNTSIGAKLN